MESTAKPYLPRGVRVQKDEIRKTHVLLAPERALMLDEISTAILGELDGVRSVDEISTHLSETYNAPKDVIEKDFLALLNDLAEKRFVDVAA